MLIAFHISVGMAAMTTEEREKLAVKLDADVDSFVAEKIAESKGRPACNSVMDQTPEELAEVCWRYTGVKKQDVQMELTTVLTTPT